MKKLLSLAAVSLFVVSVAFAQPVSVKHEPVAKKPGAKRIGVLMPVVELELKSEKVDPADAVADAFIALLASDSVEFVRLDGRSSLTAYKEARDKQCDFVLKISLVQKKAKQGGSVFDRLIDRSSDSAVSEATRKIPAGRNVPGTVGREASVGASQEVTKLEITIKMRDTFVLSYTLLTPKPATISEKSFSANAKKDNDEVMLPLIEKAAEHIAVAIGN